MGVITGLIVNMCFNIVVQKVKLFNVLQLFLLSRQKGKIYAKHFSEVLYKYFGNFLRSTKYLYRYIYIQHILERKLQMCTNSLLYIHSYLGFPNQVNS